MVTINGLADPIPRHLEQVLAPAEGDRSGGAGVGAARVETLLDPRVAHRAAHYLRVDGVVVLVGEGVVGAGHDAVATSDAYLGVVEDRPLGGLGEGVHQADRGAARLVAVHALELAVDRRVAIVAIPVPVDDRERGCPRPSNGFKNIEIADRLLRFGQGVDLGARDLARAAADAQGSVVEETVAVRIALEVLDRAGVSGT
jgi:hypothetical protein